ncbi:hypothetical protein E2562_036641 [Oryza meyeriana var. granulata]|uniref:Transposase Tnp1/En/Spm-like domain-containing protein n=1 Tax=Oryza meyeriana var. granulata TaxID=110450 RepID=A0A6G1DAQ0_9ORYZ|nr:hypothetical protein E2562_036641 [Oryza meyeriana var. granulata]
MYNLRHKGLIGRSCAASGGSSQGTSTDGANSQRVVDDCVNAQMSSGCGNYSNDGALGDAQAQQEPPAKARRGRGKRNRTQLRVPTPGRRVQLKPIGVRQFTYVNYNPKDYKYGSQVGVILKRLYPGMVDIRDEENRIVDKRAALSWHDYYSRKDETRITYARRVKAEFWTLFKVTRPDMRKAERNLESYLVKRVSDLMYQARLDAIKKHEDCNDNQARTVELTEEQYLTCIPSWCSKDAWAFLCKYWTSNEYKDKRKAAQASRVKSKDVAQNRGGSRPWGETQQLLEYKFGPDKAGTLNTYAIMKSGFKNMDNTGRSAPIPSRRAQNRLDNYNARTQLAENSKELDAQALYCMEGGFAHGRVPIADGVVDKETLIAAKSSNIRSTNTAAYRTMVEENEQLRETNQELNQTNELLIEENSVSHQMIMVIHLPFLVAIY